MHLRTYLMIKQAEAWKPEKLITINSSPDHVERCYRLFSTRKDPASQDVINDIQQYFSPKGVLPVLHNKPVYGKKPIKALPGIGPMPAGLDYGK